MSEGPLAKLKDAMKAGDVILLSPFWLGLMGYLALQPAKREAKYLLDETGSNVVLLGGNTLIIQARKL